MSASRWMTWLFLSAPIGAGWFAVAELLSARAAGTERESWVRKVSEAKVLLSRHPDVFKPTASRTPSDVSTKAIFQESSVRHGLQLEFLSEAERDGGKGKRERLLSARFVRAPHDKLVLFLGEVEARGGGAFLKEIHLRPSKEVSDLYEEAEVVLSRLEVWAGKP